MRLETLALFIAVAFGLLWLAVFVTGLLAAFPFGLWGLVPVAVLLGVLGAVVYQRLTNKEDDYYDKNVDQ